MKINKTNVKKMVWVSGTAGAYTLIIDSSIVEAAALSFRGHGCAFAGEVILADYRTAVAMQRAIRAALIGLELPEPKPLRGVLS